MFTDQHKLFSHPCPPGTNMMRPTKAAFRQLLLPLPEEDQMRRTYDGSSLVFMNPFGCVLRVTSTWREYLRPKVPEILQPLGIIRGPLLTHEIFPGVLCLIDTYSKTEHPLPPQKIPGTNLRKLVHNLRKNLADKNVEFWDPELRNAGFVPNPQGQILFENPVVIDMDAVEHFSLAIAAIKKLIHPLAVPPAPAPQETTYQPLRDLFKKAAECKDEKDQSRFMTDFWQGCFKARQRGILVSSWMGSPSLPLKNTAQKYALQLETHPPLRAILGYPITVEQKPDLIIM